jgi:dihydrofolate reductase
VAKLLYSALASLDGHVEDEHGRFDWAAPDEEVHRFVNDLERDVGTHLYGRRMYETMTAWETDPSLVEGSPVARDYAGIWQAADKVVYSRTLQDVATARTRIERELDPAAVLELKRAAQRDLSIGGAEVAGQALGAGLVDELHLFVVPVLVGGGKRCLPDGIGTELRLLDERRFESGTVYLRYAVG